MKKVKAVTFRFKFFKQKPSSSSKSTKKPKTYAFSPRTRHKDSNCPLNYFENLNKNKTTDK